MEDTGFPDFPSGIDVPRDIWYILKKCLHDDPNYIFDGFPMKI
jgi:hypothetical protein